MQWKTDWKPGNNYGRGGAQDFNRLHDNLTQIANILRSKLGIDIKLQDIVTQDFGSFPFADLLNATEGNLHKIGSLWPQLNSMPTTYPTGTFACGAKVRVKRPMSGHIRRTWYPAENAPTFEDINRWESIGRWGETTARQEKAYHECGTIGCGTDYQEPYTLRGAQT